KLAKILELFFQRPLDGPAKPGPVPAGRSDAAPGWPIVVVHGPRVASVQNRGGLSDMFLALKRLITVADCHVGVGRRCLSGRSRDCKLLRQSLSDRFDGHQTIFFRQREGAGFAAWASQDCRAATFPLASSSKPD